VTIEADPSVVRLLHERAYERRDEPFKLSSGQWSHDYVDCRRALADGDALRLVSEAIAARADALGVEYEAVGGLTMGADPLSHGVALVAGKRWFSVRKEAKGHGRQKLVEGADLSAGLPVLVVDDVVTTGRSLLQALEAVEATGARVVLAITVLDRGEQTAVALGERNIAYSPLTTYRDLGIEPIGAA
jgi:orotate phosphoribosyltransferase